MYQLYWSFSMREREVVKAGFDRKVDKPKRDIKRIVHKKTKNADALNLDLLLV